MVVANDPLRLVRVVVLRVELGHQLLAEQVRLVRGRQLASLGGVTPSPSSESPSPDHVILCLVYRLIQAVTKTPRHTTTAIHMHSRNHGNATNFKIDLLG